jgi:hypothetical protein
MSAPMNGTTLSRCIVTLFSGWLDDRTIAGRVAAG